MNHADDSPHPPPPVSRNPDTIYVLALLLVSGVGILAAGVEPESVNALVKPWMALTWAILLTVGAGVTLLGVLWRSPTDGLLIETVGRVVLAPAATAYAVAVVVAAGVGAATVAGLLLALAASSAWRVRQIRAQIRDMRAVMRAIQHRQESAS